MKCHSSPRYLVFVVAALTGCVTEDVVEGEQASSEASRAAEIPCSTCCPAAPSATTARAQGESNLKVTWSDNSLNESGFLVQRSDNGGAWHDIAQTAANAEMAIDRLYAGVISFGYRVLAFNAFCVSSPSPVVTVPKAPSHLVGVVISGATYQLTWRDDSDNETFFVVQHKAGAAAWQDLKKVGANHPTTLVTLSPGANRYRVRANATDAGASWYTNEVSQSF